MTHLQLVFPGLNKKRRALALLTFSICAFFSVSMARAATGKLQIYFVDVEGGQATLFVTPTGQSLLIDTGWPGNQGRDADRIVAAAKSAGLSRIDYVLITHYHDDHVGGVLQLAERIPVGGFIDHGPNREISNEPTQRGWENYQKLLAGGKYTRLVAKPGDTLPISGMRAVVISADGNVIDHALDAAGDGTRSQNPYCSTKDAPAADQTENGRSLGVLINFGKLRILDLGDLTADKERQLMCPVNKLGHVDILVVSHHGWYQSSSPALVDAIAPVVAIMDNGATKGGSIPVFETISKSLGLQALWQLHFSEEAGVAHNSPADYIANLQGVDHANYLKLTAGEDGKYAVFNSRTEAKKYYSLRP